MVHSLCLASPAKVNLSLHVCGRRSDAYHELSTLMQAISLADTLLFSIGHDSDAFTSDHSELPMDEDNLVLRAVRLFRSYTGVTDPIHIHLQKRIPMQAGLGGGSSNAATALWGLNRLYGTQLTEDRLSQLGAQLGSDVPFFFSTGHAYCQGRGERVESRAQPPHMISHGMVLKPNVGLSTPAVYQKWRPTQQKEELYRNDLEAPACALQPDLAGIKQRLIDCGFSYVFLCGSGSAFCCLGTGRMPIDVEGQHYKFSFVERKQDAWYEMDRKGS